MISCFLNVSLYELLEVSLAHFLVDLIRAVLIEHCLPCDLASNYYPLNLLHHVRYYTKERMS